MSVRVPEAPNKFAREGRMYVAGTATATELHSFIEGAPQSAERVTEEIRQPNEMGSELAVPSRRTKSPLFSAGLREFMAHIATSTFAAAVTGAGLRGRSLQGRVQRLDYSRCSAWCSRCTGVGRIGLGANLAGIGVSRRDVPARGVTARRHHQGDCA